MKGGRSPRTRAGQGGAESSTARRADSEGPMRVAKGADGGPPCAEVLLEERAADLALRHQAGETEALGLLYGLLEVAIEGVALNERALQPPSAMTLEELREQSRKVLAELARQWGPGVSFLGYFFRTFPSAMARYARQKQRRDEEGGGPEGTGVGGTGRHALYFHRSRRIDRTALGHRDRG